MMTSSSCTHRVSLPEIPEWDDLVAQTRTEQEDPVPEGYKNTEEWAKVFRKSISRTNRLLLDLVRLEKWEVIQLQARATNGSMRTTNYYRRKQ